MKDSSNGTNAQTNDDDDDAFWQVAFMGRNEPLSIQQRLLHHGDDDDDNNSSSSSKQEDSNNDKTTTMTTTTTPTRYQTYTIPNSHGVTLRVQPLASTDGIWTPLGAEAWYVVVCGM